ncbi:CBN-CLEC-50 protein [Aphelenchoides avenae]|nr:CBN-CLEC-50 protein [Aphelenchus avenae]
MEAKLHCNSRNGHLVTVDDGFTNMYLNDEAQQLFGSVPQSFFIGANDIATKGSWTWDDGSGPLKYQPWAVGEPSQHAGFDCASVTLRDGLWHAGGCFDRRPFVCSLPQVSSACPPPPSCPASRHAYYCDDGWTIYKDHCYQVTASFNVTFWDARAECQERNADLVSIHSQGEKDFVRGFARHDPPVFEGLVRPCIWIGLMYDYPKGQWTWTDNSIFNYSKLEPK